MNAEEWIRRCKRCKNASLHSSYEVICTLARGVDCRFEEIPKDEELPKRKRFKRCTVDYSNMTEKMCRRCGKVKPVEEFIKRINKGRIYYAECKRCGADRQKALRKEKRIMKLEQKIEEINKKLEDKSISNSERYALMQELDENLYLLKERNSDE